MFGLIVRLTFEQKWFCWTHHKSKYTLRFLKVHFIFPIIAYDGSLSI